MLILDTDHLAALEGRSQARDRLARRLEDSGEEIAATVISAEEELRGWLAQIHREVDPHEQINAYERLRRRLEFFAGWTVLPWDSRAADQFVHFRRQRIRCGSMDLKIASITIIHGATLLTRNTIDFSRVPGLSFENWLD